MTSYCRQADSRTASNTFSIPMEPEGSLLYSQEPYPWLYLSHYNSVDIIVPNFIPLLGYQTQFFFPAFLQCAMCTCATDLSVWHHEFYPFLIIYTINRIIYLWKDCVCSFNSATWFFNLSILWCRPHYVPCELWKKTLYSFCYACLLNSAGWFLTLHLCGLFRVAFNVCYERNILKFMLCMFTRLIMLYVF